MNFETISQFVVSATVVVIAARWLAFASDEMAKVTGLSHLFIGSLFLAASTSAPEFFVDIRATLDNLPNLASGDLLGSSLMNLMIFSILAFLFGATEKPIESPGIRLASLLAALLTAEVGALIYWKPSWHFLGLSIGSFLILGTYLFGTRLIFKKAVKASPEGTAPSRSTRKIFKPMLRFFLAALVLFFASPMLVGSMERISLQTGLGNTFLGASLLAFTTSLPELISSITASRMGLFDLFIGNIVGSNAINMLIFVFMDWIWSKAPLWDHLGEKNLLICAAVVLNMLALAFTWKSSGKAHPWRTRLGTTFILLLSMGCYAALFLLQNKQLGR